MIVEPCCVNKQLPKAIIEAPHRVLMFHTNGDVSLEKFYRAIASAIADPAVMVLTLPTVDIHTMRLLVQCFDRDWITDLVLTTSADITKFVESELRDYLPHVSYCHTVAVSFDTSMLSLFSQRQALFLHGSLPLAPSKKAGLSTYTLIFQPSIPLRYTGENGDHLHNALEPIITLHRQHLRTDKEYLRTKSPRLANVLQRIYINPDQ